MKADRVRELRPTAQRQELRKLRLVSDLMLSRGGVMVASFRAGEILDLAALLLALGLAEPIGPGSSPELESKG